PYRREMLLRLGVPFEAIAPDINEAALSGESPDQMAVRLSVAKAHAVAAHHPGALVIGSDQVATLDGSPIGKPGDFQGAQQQLRQFRGRTVEFHSALCVTDGRRDESADVV